jgi:hypothetical protein
VHHFSCPSKSSNFPVATSHKYTFPSLSHDAILDPSSDNATSVGASSLPLRVFFASQVSMSQTINNLSKPPVTIWLSYKSKHVISNLWPPFAFPRMHLSFLAFNSQIFNSQALVLINKSFSTSTPYRVKTDSGPLFPTGSFGKDSSYLH